MLCPLGMFSQTIREDAPLPQQSKVSIIEEGEINRVPRGATSPTLPKR